MAIAVVQRKNSPSTRAATLTITSATAGNVLIAFIAQIASTSAPTIKDNIGAGWTVNGTSALNNGSANSLWVATKTAVGGETTLEATPGAGGTVEGVAACEASGASTTVDVIVATNNAATAKTLTSNGVTTTDAGDLILACVSFSALNSGVIEAWTGTGPMTNAETTASRCFTGALIPGTTLSGATFTANWPTSHPNDMLVVAIKPAAAEGEHASRTAADTITVSDSVVVSGARPRTVEDTVAVSDAVVRTSAKARTTADTVSISDAAVGQKTKLVTVADTITLSDAATRSAQVLARTASDTVTVSEQAVRTSAKARTTADTVTLSDAVSRAATHSRTTADTVTISDALARGALVFVRSASDTITVTDAVVASHTGGVVTEPPTGTPLAGHITVGRTGRLARATGRIVTTNSGRARR